MPWRFGEQIIFLSKWVMAVGSKAVQSSMVISTARLVEEILHQLI